MRYTAYLEMLTNDSSSPCYVADVNTHDILYLNQLMVDLLKNYNQYQGKKCYEVIHGMEKPCDFCPNQQADLLKFVEQSVYNGVSQCYFRVNTTLMQLEERTVNLSKYFISTSMEKKLSPSLSFESALWQCGNILSQDTMNHSEFMVDSFLELLGDFYGAEKCYIFQMENEKMSNTHFWVQDEATISMMHLNQPEVMQRLTAWLSHYEDLSVIEINSASEKYPKDSVEQQVLEAYHIRNMALCPLKNGKNQLFGFVGISNRSTPFFDYRLLKAVARFVQDSFSVLSMEQELEKLNHIDVLTGFYNRNRYATYLQELQDSQPKSLGILFVNLNGLRKTNEFFGYEVGDLQILKAVAQLKNHFTEDFYRISGDEFLCFIPDCDHVSFTERVKVLQDELKISKNNSFSVGSSWNQGNYDVLQLIAAADTIMYINKQEYYFNTMQDNQEMADSILQDLLHAIQNQEFLVYLQPKVQLSTGKVSGAEALIRRFDEKNQKMIYPDNFIPLYEKNSIIRHVDLFVLDKVCQMLALWGDSHERVPISVNLSRVTLTEYDIVQTVTGICNKHDVPHNLIMLEVTERVGLLESDVASSLVEAFQKEGFKVSLDDFGCAYSNIVTLAQISVDEVKIDKSLVDDLSFNPKNKIILENMIHMCNSLENTTTLAEGIEWEGQADSLRAIKCGYGQGYLYSKPIPHEEFYERYIVKDKMIARRSVNS